MPSQKIQLYAEHPTYSRPLPSNFSAKSDIAKALFGLRLTLEEERRSNFLKRFMTCQVPMQGDNVKHSTTINLGNKNHEDFAQLKVSRCGRYNCGTPSKFVTLQASEADRIVLFERLVNWLIMVKAKASLLERIKKMADKIMGVECRSVIGNIEKALASRPKPDTTPRKRRSPQSSPPSTPTSRVRDDRMIHSSPAKTSKRRLDIDVDSNETPSSKRVAVANHSDDEVIFVGPVIAFPSKGKGKAVDKQDDADLILIETPVSRIRKEKSGVNFTKDAIWISSDEESSSMAKLPVTRPVSQRGIKTLPRPFPVRLNSPSPFAIP
ncbi:hypothetical protein GYMLUDRAFT_249937 [Collybiopsis luxurians FD-317 M1]|uniref:Uncharacterized protein n=1 Tax=Collybiopsis luxurians FD-317 M1 TaxID=944289 RepID=A0A0D0BGQ2_9AGAR|nr:hypothetical protein GYMLUDRAFT_249937 [Collybiopsis luxurians FD-317 M1]